MFINIVRVKTQANIMKAKRQKMGQTIQRKTTDYIDPRDP